MFQLVVKVIENDIVEWMEKKFDVKGSKCGECFYCWVYLWEKFVIKYQCGGDVIE